MTVPGWAEAWEECQASLAEGGVPAAAALVDASGTVIGRGHNQRYQRGDITSHAHVEALRNVGRLLTMDEMKSMTFVSTSIPCIMCAGLLVHFGFKKQVSGFASFEGHRTASHDFLERHGVEVVDLQLPEVAGAWAQFIAAHPDDWAEDVGTSVAGLDLDELIPRLGELAGSA